MADPFDYRVTFVPARAENSMGVQAMAAICRNSGKEGFRLVQVLPVIEKGETTGWILVFERRD